VLSEVIDLAVLLFAFGFQLRFEALDGLIGLFEGCLFSLQMLFGLFCFVFRLAKEMVKMSNFLLHFILFSPMVFSHKIFLNFKFIDHFADVVLQLLDFDAPFQTSILLACLFLFLE
jgi:hypothetical protein